MLITSETCAPCKVVKEKIDKEGLSVEVYQVHDPAVRPFFNEHDIRSVPTLFVDNEMYIGLDPIMERLNLG